MGIWAHDTRKYETDEDQRELQAYVQLRVYKHHAAKASGVKWTVRFCIEDDDDATKEFHFDLMTSIFDANNRTHVGGSDQWLTLQCRCYDLHKGNLCY